LRVLFHYLVFTIITVFNVKNTEIDLSLEALSINSVLRLSQYLLLKIQKLS